MTLALDRARQGSIAFVPVTDAPAGKKGLSTGAIIAIVAGVVVLVVVAVVGVMAALGIAGFRNYLGAAKSAEGRAEVGRLARGMALCGPGRGADGQSAALPPTAPPVPATLAEVSGKKYMSSSADWSDPAYTCAAFSVSMPQYFRYQWLATSDTEGVARAEADLDGDGTAEVIFESKVTCAGEGCTAGPISPP